MSRLGKRCATWAAIGWLGVVLHPAQGWAQSEDAGEGDADAEDALVTRPYAARPFRVGRSLGGAGMVVGYAGPPLIAVGSLRMWFGAAGVIGSSVVDDEANPDAEDELVKGLMLFGVGWTAGVVGPAMLSTGSVVAGRASGSGRAPVAGWIAVGGSIVQVASVGVRLSNGELLGAGTGIGVVGWSAAMVGGTIQHVQNGRARPKDNGGDGRQRVAVRLVPTPSGALLMGSF